MTYSPSNPNGQAAMADSQPVAIANNQSAVPVSGTVTANTGLSQPLTDAQLRAVAVPVSGTVTANTGLTQPLTDAELRATAVPVSGTFYQATQPVSAASLPLPTGAATETTLAALNTKVTAVNTGAVVVSSSALPSGASTLAEQQTQTTSLGTIDTSVNTLLKPASTLAAVTTVGTVSSVTAIANALPAGDNNIGNVDIVTLPSLPAGTNNIGDVDVLSLPATPAGTNLIGFTSQAGQSGNTNALTEVDSTALASSQVIKSSSGRLYRLSGVNTGPAQYIQVFNATSAPANGTAPILLCYAPSFSNFSFDLGNFGKYFSTGITVTNSTTAATKTLGSADCWFNAGCL